MNVQWTDEAERAFLDLENKAKAANNKRVEKGKTKSSPIEGLFKQVLKTIRLLKENPRHPGLNTHEYHTLDNPVRPGEKVFEAYAQNRTPGAYRVFWCYGPDKEEITIIAITPHP